MAASRRVLADGGRRQGGGARDRDGATDWTSAATAMNETLFEAVSETTAAQSRFLDAYVDAVEESWVASPDRLADGVEGYGRATTVWLEAAEDALDRVGDAVEGEDVSAEEFRDIWLSAANEAFTEVMGTSAFAAATGETVEDALALQRAVDEATEETLRAAGVATRGDVTEVGDRLVELERRQQAVERRLDRILEVLDEHGDGAGAAATDATGDGGRAGGDGDADADVDAAEGGGP